MIRRKSEYTVPKVLRNQIFQEIEQDGLSPADFEWEDLEEGERVIGERLMHRPTGFYFEYSLGGGGFWMAWRPPLPNGNTCDATKSDGGQLAYTVRWLDYVKADHEAPDLWATVLREADVVAGNVDEEDRRFTQDERRRLAEQLHEVEAFLTKVRPLTSEQAQWLHVRIEYVTEATNRLTLKDWKLLFLGVLTQVTISLALDQATARELFAFIGHNVLSILGAIRGLIR